MHDFLRPSRARLPLALIIPALLTGCAQAAPAEGDLVVERSIRGDTQVVQTIRGSAWTGPPRIVEEVRIGALDGAPEYLFGTVSFLAIGRDGAIFVADSQGPRVRMYDADGVYVRDVGRRGEGPGEYMAVGGLRVTPAGELALWDQRLFRISFFDPSGEFVRSMRSHVGGFWTGRDFFVDRAGNLLVYGSRPSAAAPVITLSDGGRVESEGPGMRVNFLLKLSPSGEPLDTIFIPVSTAPRQPSFVVLTPEGALQPFVDRLVYDYSPEGYLVTGYASHYSIDLHLGSGGVRRIERDYRPLPLNRDERSEWEARAAYYTRTLPANAASAGVVIPAAKPAFRDLQVDDDGRIWVHRYAEATQRVLRSAPAAGRPPPIRWRDVPTFDVFDPDGRFLGTVVVPENTRFLVRRGNHLWGVHQGEFDESYVVRYRMVGES